MLFSGASVVERTPDQCQDSRVTHHLSQKTQTPNMLNITNLSYLKTCYCYCYHCLSFSHNVLLLLSNKMPCIAIKIFYWFMWCIFPPIGKEMSQVFLLARIFLRIAYFYCLKGILNWSWFGCAGTSINFRGLNHSTYVFKVSLKDNSYCAQMRAWKWFYFFILTLSTAICCGFFFMTNGLIVSRFGKKHTH